MDRAEHTMNIKAEQGRAVQTWRIMDETQTRNCSGKIHLSAAEIASPTHLGNVGLSN
jgi:hypothetical protein